MRFTNSECLKKMLLAVEQEVTSASSENVSLAMSVVKLGLEELLKREEIMPSILMAAISAGVSIADQQIEFLEKLDAKEIAELKGSLEKIHRVAPGRENPAGLRLQYNDLLLQLESGSRLLAEHRTSADKEQGPLISDLLKKTAAWELSVYEQNSEAMPETYSSTSGYEPVLEADALEAFIRKQQPAEKKLAVENLRTMQGGFGKETWTFDLVTDDRREQLVARKASIAPGSMQRGVFGVRQEFPLVKILYQEGILVPKPLWLGLDEPGINSPFYISRRINGKTMGTFESSDPELPEEVWLQVAEQMAWLHTIPIQRFTDYIREFESEALVNCTATEGMLYYLNWWHDYWKSFDRQPSPLEIYLFDWLYNNLPKNSRPASVLHTDMGAHNMLADGRRLTAILDWETSLFGSPALDLGYVRKWVTEKMDWQRFLEHYYSFGGPEMDESEFSFCDALVYLRWVTASNMRLTQAGQNTGGYTELIWGSKFFPEAMKSAFNSTIDDGR